MYLDYVLTPDTNYIGCHPTQKGSSRRGESSGSHECYMTDYSCEVSAERDGNNIKLAANGIPDHHAWGLTPGEAEVKPQKYNYDIPSAPVLLSLEESMKQIVGGGVAGLAVNGVPFFNPYNSKCCDVMFDELATMDFCLGHPMPGGNYHYHFFGYDAGDGRIGGVYDGCRMECSGSGPSDFVGVALDGFPVYGPMQWYSKSQKKVYNNKCSDCELVQITSDMADICGGLEVGDGNADEGGQYRYIITGEFPYTYQCFRGRYTGRVHMDCGLNGRGPQNNCDIWNQDYINSLGNCYPGNCPHYPEGSTMYQYDAAYFKCTDASTTSTTKPPLTTSGNTLPTTKPTTVNPGPTTRPQPGSQPNILFILSDDQGFSDVPWKNKRLRMPHLEMLRRDGVSIEGAYSQPSCTPSRVALLTGRYPWTVGFPSEGVLDTYHASGIPLTEKLFPEFMKDAGYDTYFYGKWHLGYCDQRLRPENRGFDSSYGFMSSGISYVDHEIPMQTNPVVSDYWANYTFVDNKEYTTDDFVKRALLDLDTRRATGDQDPFFMMMNFNAPHSPILAPPNVPFLNHFDGVPDGSGRMAGRKSYMQTLWRMDYKIGEMINKLKEIGEYDNTIVVFQSDNGGDNDPQSGFNYPLRGEKGTFTEGGQRVPAFISGAGIKPGILERSRFMHLTDWLPTIADFAGMDPNTLGDLDGHSFKDTFTSGSPSPRDEMFYLLSTRQSGVIRKRFDDGRDLKVVYNDIKRLTGMDHKIPDEGECDLSDLAEEGDTPISDISKHASSLKGSKASDGKDIIIFDLAKDPFELFNVYEQNKNDGEDLVKKLKDTSAYLAENVGVINLTASAPTSEQSKSYYPKNSARTTSGWCDGDTILPDKNGGGGGRTTAGPMTTDGSGTTRPPRTTDGGNTRATRQTRQTRGR